MCGSDRDVLAPRPSDAAQAGSLLSNMQEQGEDMYYFIVNLTSRTGKARKIWIALERELQKKGVPYEAYITQYKGHARELANALCERSVKRKEEGQRAVLVVVGGDGTANEVINGMRYMDKVLFGYIPTGSGNDLGRGLGISNHPIEALNGILEAREDSPMDLGCVTDEKGTSRYFCISSGIGIDADVCRMALTSRLKTFLNHVKLGSLTYVLLTVKALFTMPTTEVQAVFEQGAPKTFSKMIFMAGMNHPWEGGGVPMAPKANAFDGKLSVCCVHGIPKWKAFFLLPVLVKGKHEMRKGFDVVDCERYELRLKTPMVLHGDGEYLGEQKVIRYECLNGRLRVLK